jgi:hypothetical protein
MFVQGRQSLLGGHGRRSGWIPLRLVNQRGIFGGTLPGRVNPSLFHVPSDHLIGSEIDGKLLWRMPYLGLRGISRRDLQGVGEFRASLINIESLHAGDALSISPSADGRTLGFDRRTVGRCGTVPRGADNRGRSWNESRAVLNGVFWVLRTGAQWRELPEKYLLLQACHRRFQQWV